MRNLLRANFQRLMKSRIFWIGLFATIGYVLFLLLMNYIEFRSHVSDSIMSVNWYILSPFSILSLFCPVFCSMYIGTEYSDATMRNLIIVGHTKRAIYTANFLTVSFACVVIAVCTSLFAALVDRLLFGWNMVYPMQFVLYYFSGLLMLIATSSLFTFMAMLISNKASSVLVCVLMLIASFVLETVIRSRIFNAEAIYSEVGLLVFLYDCIPMGQCFQLTSGMVFHPFRLPIYSLLFISATIGCGIVFFEKKDLK